MWPIGSRHADRQTDRSEGTKSLSLTLNSGTEIERAADDRREQSGSLLKQGRRRRRSERKRERKRDVIIIIACRLLCLCLRNREQRHQRRVSRREEERRARDRIARGEPVHFHRRTHPCTQAAEGSGSRPCGPKARGREPTHTHTQTRAARQKERKLREAREGERKTANQHRKRQESSSLVARRLSLRETDAGSPVQRITVLLLRHLHHPWTLDRRLPKEVG